MRVALILGAGWSAAAGYPLARDLLRGAVYAGTEPSRLRVRAVLDAYRRWAGPAELFLDAVRAGEVLAPPGPDDEPTLFDGGGRPLPWHWAVEAVVLKLLWPDGRNGGAELLPSRAEFRKRHGGHLDEPAGAASHLAFVRSVLAEHELAGVVTTNYDTLAEGVLRGAFHYGGLGPRQRALGASAWDYYNDPEPDRHAIELAGPIALCKLHGSLNWELDGGRVAIWRDMRPPSRDPAAAAITGANVDPWLAPVWQAAEQVLRAAERWIVVGYSAPPFDTAAGRLLETAARRGALAAVDLHDPAPEVSRWEEVAGVPVTTHPGIPSEPAPTREVSRLAFFYGIDVYIAKPPTEPPHFRARYGSSRATISLPALDVLDGSLPPRALGLVREWAGANLDALTHNWSRAQANQEPEPIAPLD